MREPLVHDVYSHALAQRVALGWCLVHGPGLLSRRVRLCHRAACCVWMVFGAWSVSVVASHRAQFLHDLLQHTDRYVPLSISGGNGNRLLNSTVLYFGNAGVTTYITNTPPAAQGKPQPPPQPMAGRDLEVAFCHIHHGGLIGKDSAALYTGGWNAAGLHWHHNWVHDASEKCMRGDDQSRNMTVHHNVSKQGAVSPSASMSLVTRHRPP